MRIFPVFLLLLIPFAYSDVCADCHSLIILTSYFNATTNDTTIFATLLYTNETYFQTLNMTELMKVLKNPEQVPTPEIPEGNIPTANFSALADADITFAIMNYTQTPPENNITGCDPAKTNENGVAVCTFKMEGKECQNLEAKFNGLPDRGIREGSSTLLICPPGYIPALSIGDAIAAVLAYGPTTNMCLPLFLVAGLLLGSLFLAGKEPFAIFDITTPHMPHVKKFPFVRTFVWEGWAFQRRQLSAQQAILSNATGALIPNFSGILRKKGVSSALIDKIRGSKASNEQKLMALRMLSLGYGGNKVEKWLKKKVDDAELAKWNKDLYDEAKKKRFSTAERQALDASASFTENSIWIRENIHSLAEKTHVGHKVGQIPLVHMAFDAVGGMKEQMKWIKDNAKTVGVLLPLYALRGTGSLAGRAGAPKVRSAIDKSKFVKWLEDKDRNPEKKPIGRLEDAEKKIVDMKELVEGNMKNDVLLYLVHTIIDRKNLTKEGMVRYDTVVRKTLQSAGLDADAKIRFLGEYLNTEFGDRSGLRMIGQLRKINDVTTSKGLSNLEMLKALYFLGESERGKGKDGFDFMTGKQLSFEEIKKTLTDKEYMRQLMEGQHPGLVTYDDVKTFMELSIKDEEQGLGCYQTRFDEKTKKLDFVYETLPWGIKRKYLEPRPMVDLKKKEETARKVLSLLADKIDGAETVIDVNGKLVRKSEIANMLTKEMATLRKKGLEYVREDRPLDKEPYTPVASALIQLLRTGSDRFKLDVAYDWKVSRAGGPPSDARLGLEMGPAGARLSVYDLLIGRYKYGTWAIEEKEMNKTGESLLYNRLISRLGGIEYGGDLYGVEKGRFEGAPQGFNPLRNFIDRNENITKEYWRRITGKKGDPSNAELRRFSTSEQYKKFIEGGATFEKIDKGMWVATAEGTFAPLYGPMMATGEADKQINTMIMVKDKDGRWVRYRPLTHEHDELKRKYDQQDAGLIEEARAKGWKDEQLTKERTNLVEGMFRMIPKSEYPTKYGARGVIYGGWASLGRFADKLTIGAYTESMKEMEDHLAVTTHSTGRAFKLFRDIGMDKYQEIAGPMRYTRYIDEKNIEARSRQIREAVPRRDERLNEALRAYASEWPGFAALATTTITGRDARTQSTSYGIRQTFRGLSHTGQAMFSGPTTFSDRGAFGSMIGAGVPGMRGRFLRTAGKMFQLPYIATSTALQASYAPVLGALTAVRTPLEYMMGYPGGAYDQLDQPIPRRPAELASMLARPTQMFDWEMVPYLTRQFKVAGALNPFGELFAKRVPGEYEPRRFGEDLLGRLYGRTVRFGASMRGGYYSEIGRSGTDKLMDGVRRPMEVWPDAKYVSRMHTIPVSAGFAYSTFRFYTPLYPRIAEWIMSNEHLKSLAMASDIVEKSAKAPIHRRGIEYAAAGIESRTRTAFGQLTAREEEFGIYSPLHYPTSMALSPAFIPWFAGGRVITDAVTGAVSRAGATPTGGRGKVFRETFAETLRGGAGRISRPRRAPVYGETEGEAERRLGYAEGFYQRVRGNIVHCPYCGASMIRGGMHACQVAGRKITDVHFLLGREGIRKVGEEARQAALRVGKTAKEAERARRRAEEELKRMQTFARGPGGGLGTAAVGWAAKRLRKKREEA
jgi:hypothetical protein